MTYQANHLNRIFENNINSRSGWVSSIAARTALVAFHQTSAVWYDTDVLRAIRSLFSILETRIEAKTVDADRCAICIVEAVASIAVDIQALVVTDSLRASFPKHAIHRIHGSLSEETYRLMARFDDPPFVVGCQQARPQLNWIAPIPSKSFQHMPSLEMVDSQLPTLVKSKSEALPDIYAFERHFKRGSSRNAPQLQG